MVFIGDDTNAHEAINRPLTTAFPRKPYAAINPVQTLRGVNNGSQLRRTACLLCLLSTLVFLLKLSPTAGEELSFEGNAIPQFLQQWEAKPQMTSEEPNVTLRSLAASGTSSVFWLNGIVLDDYPYACVCDPGDLAQRAAGQLEAPQSGSGDWWNPFDSGTPKESSGVRCVGTFSTALLGGDKPYCDVENGSVGKHRLKLYITIFIIMGATVWQFWL